jgi:hypothetical protein
VYGNCIQQFCFNPISVFPWKRTAKPICVKTLLFNSAWYFLHGSLILLAAEDVNVSAYVLIYLSIYVCLSVCLPVGNNFPVLRCSLIPSCFLPYLLVIICEYCTRSPFLYCRDPLCRYMILFRDTGEVH